MEAAVIATTPESDMDISPVTATSAATPDPFPTIILPAAMPSNLVRAIAAEAFISALTIVSSAIIPLVTVPTSLFVIKVPEMLGKSIVLSAVVGSTTPKVVSNASALAPSKTSDAV